MATRYGLRFAESQTDLDIELFLIANGGKYMGKGLGLFEHFMRARKLAWPERYRHEWTDLLYQNFIANDITIMLGAASTQKSSHAAEYGVLRFLSSPHNTLVIMSTIDMDKLDTGIWAEVKMLWSKCKESYPNIAGNIIEHRRCIAYDSVVDGEVRDMRRGLLSRPCYVGGQWVGLGKLAGTKQENIVYLCDECFPEGTPVLTPTGYKRIESLKAGDSVLTACGPNNIEAIKSRYAKSFVSVISKDGRIVRCTPEHPFLTQHGWIKACNLNQEHYMLSPYETLRILPPNFSTKTPTSSLLLPILPRQVVAQSARLQSEILHEVTRDEDIRIQRAMAQEQSQRIQTSGTHHAFTIQGTRNGTPSKIKPRYEDKRMVSSHSWWKRNRANQTRIETADGRSWQCVEFPNPDWNETREWLSDLLQSGRSNSQSQTSDRSRWIFPHNDIPRREGREKGWFASGSWVDRVEVQEQSHHGFSNNDFYSCGHRVYNLQVEGHPSYVVNGFVVHNCQFMAETFIKSWANLFSNGNVKIIGSGNPKHDLDDQLSLAAEPKEGWASIGEPKVTMVWDTRFMGGKCVNLVGLDSPNFRAVAKGKPEPYKALIGPKFAARIAHDYGENSPEYYTQVKGVMLMGDEVNRVITRQSCREHHALEKAQWLNSVRTKVHGLDPSYGGRDECVSTIVEFGKDPESKEIVRVALVKVHRFILSNEKSVEDQIAEQVSELLTAYDIPPSNSFYDPYGKGTIGFAFSRKFGSNCPIPVDSGGKPTERPVRQDLYVHEKDGSKRLKKCSEEYSKFVTEAWFSVRYAIEAEQMRELPEEVMNEGCSRMYRTVAANKKEVESKDDLKERTGKSPNKFDSLAIAIEGARQRGFKIGRLGLSIDNSSISPFKWLGDKRRQHADLLESKRLTYV